MVDFNELKDKAQDLVAQHADTIKDGITKTGDFVGEKVGHDKVDPIEEKLHSLVDRPRARTTRASDRARPPGRRGRRARRPEAAGLRFPRGPTPIGRPASRW